MSAQSDVLAVLKDARTCVTHAHCQIVTPIGTVENYDAAIAAVAALIAERDALREALEKLVEAADTSDECRYGTLATGFVRDIARTVLTTGESA